MKKIFLLLVLLNGIIFAEGLYKEDEVFVKDGKMYLLKDDKVVNGILTTVGEGTTIYSTYENGVKVKERVLNTKREIISEYSLDNNGLVNGKSFVSNENGEAITGEYKKGIINGNAKQEYYGEFDFDGQFIFGVAHGKVKAIDINGNKSDYSYSNGIQSKSLETSIYNNYINAEFVKAELLWVEKDIAKKDGKLFTGIGFKSDNGFVNEAYYYLDGVKKSEFYFAQGMMYSAKFYKTATTYEEYTFYEEMNKGVLNSINTYVNGQLNGNFRVYYLDGGRQEGVYVNGELKGKALYYNLDNKITEVKIYQNKTYKSTVYFDFDKGKVASISEGKYNDQLWEWINTGKTVYYNENGKVEEEINYTDDNKSFSKTYYPSGKVKMTGQKDVASGFYTGEVNEYYENGILKAKYNYSEGYLDGMQYYYDAKGIQTDVVEYEYGEIID